MGRLVRFPRRQYYELSFGWNPLTSKDTKDRTETLSLRPCHMNFDRQRPIDEVANLRNDATEYVRS